MHSNYYYVTSYPYYPFWIHEALQGYEVGDKMQNFVKNRKSTDFRKGNYCFPSEYGNIEHIIANKIQITIFKFIPKSCKWELGTSPKTDAIPAHLINSTEFCTNQQRCEVNSVLRFGFSYSVRDRKARKMFFE